jgi:hypothetical protein
LFDRVSQVTEALEELAERVLAEQGYIDDKVVSEARSAARLAARMLATLHALRSTAHELSTSKCMAGAPPLRVGACYRVVRAFPTAPAASLVSPDDDDMVKVLSVDPRFPESAVVRVAYRAVHAATMEMDRGALEQDPVTQDRLDADFEAQKRRVVELERELACAKDKVHTIDAARTRLARIEYY